MLLDDMPQSLSMVFCGLLLFLIYRALTSQSRPLRKYPVPTLPGLTPKQSFQERGTELLRKGWQLYGDQPFQVITGTGPRIVLPNKFAEDIRHHPHLSFTKSIKVDFFPQYPGFEGPRATFEENHGRLIQDTVRIRLTQSLGSIAGDLVEEATFALKKILGESGQWRSVAVRDDTLEIIARLSSRVFLGEEVCRDESWIEIAKNHTINVFSAASELRVCPAILRPILVWFLPHCAKIRREVRESKKVISKEFERRKLEAQKAQAMGDKPPKKTDAIAWMVELSKGEPFDVIAAQLALVVGALQTTSEALSHALLHLCQNPGVVQPIREEAAQVLRQHGCTKTALHQLRLMDSFLKESQRFHREIWGIQRYAEVDIELSNGVQIPKGRRILVETKHFDPELFPEPYKFDAFRFLRMREQPGQESSWQFISTDSEYLAFGYGHHECPGRFFAMMELKIALCQLILKYDWRSIPGEPPEPDLEIATTFLTNPNAQLQAKRIYQYRDVLT